MKSQILVCPKRQRRKLLLRVLLTKRLYVSTEAESFVFQAGKITNWPFLPGWGSWECCKSTGWNRCFVQMHWLAWGCLVFCILYFVSLLSQLMIMFCIIWYLLFGNWCFCSTPFMISFSIWWPASRLNNNKEFHPRKNLQEGPLLCQAKIFQLLFFLFFRLCQPIVLIFVEFRTQVPYQNWYRCFWSGTRPELAGSKVTRSVVTTAMVTEDVIQ